MPSATVVLTATGFRSVPSSRNGPCDDVRVLDQGVGGGELGGDRGIARIRTVDGTGAVLVRLAGVAADGQPGRGAVAVRSARGAGAVGRDARDRGDEDDARDRYGEDALLADPAEQAPTDRARGRDGADGHRGRAAGVRRRRLHAADPGSTAAMGRLRVGVVAGVGASLLGRRSRPMTRWTPTGALSNTVSWRVDGRACGARGMGSRVDRPRVADSSWGLFFAAERPLTTG